MCGKTLEPWVPEFSMLIALFSSLFLTAQAIPTVPVANAATPATMVNTLAVKRDWTLTDNDFCRSRAAVNTQSVYPRTPTSKLKYIKTYSFKAKSAAANERLMLDYTNAGFQVPFPWQEGQWLARQYTAQMTPKYTYLVEMQDRPKDPGAYSVVANVCMTVYGLR